MRIIKKGDRVMKIIKEGHQGRFRCTSCGCVWEEVTGRFLPGGCPSCYEGMMCIEAVKGKEVQSEELGLYRTDLSAVEKDAVFRLLSEELHGDLRKETPSDSEVDWRLMGLARRICTELEKEK